MNQTAMTFFKPLFLVSRTSLLVMTCLSFTASTAKADPNQLYVLGVIASAKPQDGIVLIKNKVTDRTFAARVGQEIDHDVFVHGVERDYIYLSINGKTKRVKVGDESVSEQAGEPAIVTGPGAQLPLGMEKSGNTVKLTQALRDHIVKNDLSKIMMQAAAVPVYEDGMIQGFKLLDIEPGSLYELAGIANGDVVTAINDQPLGDVGRAIRVLQSLRNEAQASMAIIREGQKMTINVVIQ